MWGESRGESSGWDETGMGLVMWRVHGLRGVVWYCSGVVEGDHYIIIA